MELTLRRIFLIVGIALMVTGALALHWAKSLPEVQNTYRALEWAQNDTLLAPYFQQGYSRELCEMAVKAYMDANNLSPFTFRYVCWDWRGPPKSSSQTLAEVILGVGLGFALMGVPGLRR